ncbi:MAG: hypothetical protein R3B09_26620 [Nannocystaceae bacterium]
MNSSGEGGTVRRWTGGGATRRSPWARRAQGEEPLLAQGAALVVGGDLDGDGRDDLVISSGVGSSLLLARDDDLLLAHRVDLLVELVADVDGRGRADLVDRLTGRTILFGEGRP